MTSEVKLNNKSGRNAAPKKRKIASLDKRKARVGWIFVLPFILGFVCIYLPIIFNSLKDTFYLAETIRSEPEFVGFRNYQTALTEHAFLETLLPGLGEMIFDIPAILLFSLFMAILLNQKMAGRAAFRAIFFLPVVLATGIMTPTSSSSSMDSMGFDSGAESSATSDIVSALDIEALFANMAVGQELVSYVVKIINDIYDIVNRSGVQMLIFLSGLQSISPAIYEACKIDGATGWETFWKITFPMISPMILVNAVYTVIDAFTTENNTVMTFIDNVNKKEPEVGAAMAWMYFLMVILIIGAVSAFMSMFVFYQRKD